MRATTREAALAAAVLLALTGCSSGSDSADTSGDSSPSSAADAPNATASASPSLHEVAPETPAENPQGEKAGEQKPRPESVDLADSTFPTSVENALETTTKTIGSGGTLHEVGMEWSSSDGTWVWETVTRKGESDHLVRIDAETGKVVRHTEQQDSDPVQAVDPTTPLSYRDALTKAKEVRNNQVVEWSLEGGENKIDYEVVLNVDGDNTDVVVDVPSGEARLD